MQHLKQNIIKLGLVHTTFLKKVLAKPCREVGQTLYETSGTFRFLPWDEFACRSRTDEVNECLDMLCKCDTWNQRSRLKKIQQTNNNFGAAQLLRLFPLSYVRFNQRKHAY